MFGAPLRAPRLFGLAQDFFEYLAERVALSENLRSVNETPGPEVGSHQIALARFGEPAGHNEIVVVPRETVESPVLVQVVPELGIQKSLCSRQDVLPSTVGSVRKKGESIRRSRSDWPTPVPQCPSFLCIRSVLSMDFS